MNIADLLHGVPPQNQLPQSMEDPCSAAIIAHWVHDTLVSVFNNTADRAYFELVHFIDLEGHRHPHYVEMFVTNNQLREYLPGKLSPSGYRFELWRDNTTPLDAPTGLILGFNNLHDALLQLLIEDTKAALQVSWATFFHQSIAA